MSLFVFWYIQIVFKNRSIDSLHNKTKMIASISASLIAPGLYFHDPETINNELGILSRQSEINYIAVFDPKDSLIFVFNKTLHNKLIDTSKFSYSGNFQNTIFESTYVIFENENVGEITVGISTEEIEMEIAEISTAILVLSLVILVIGISVALVLSYLITRPIDEIVKTAAAVKEGNFNIRAGVKSNDELGFLAHEFNEMIDKLNVFYNNLENVVKVRTAKLAEINNMLELEIQEKIQAEEKIRHSLDEKIVLLKEIHHRVKNNLQIISSLFYLQGEKIEDPQVKSLFADSQERIRSIALVHEKLYKTENFTYVDFPDYVKSFVEKFSIAGKGSFAKFEINIQQFYISINEAIPLGLIVNEIIINSLKHAFNPDLFDNESEKKIYINGSVNADQVRLEIGDNGIGFPENFNIAESNSLGLKLIHGLIQQIGATVSIENLNGAKYSIILTLKTQVFP